MVAGLHLMAGWKEYTRIARQKYQLTKSGFFEICDLNDIEENCAKTIFIDKENIAIFKYDGKVSAVNNVCRHQMGPLGEGKIIDGCITCPWHGYQYLPENGQSPPPFDEKVNTYEVQIVDKMVWLNPNPHPPGTPITPASIKASNS